MGSDDQLAVLRVAGLDIRPLDAVGRRRRASVTSPSPWRARGAT
jgi:hypothetical protein